MRLPVSSISIACLRATLRVSATMGVEQNRPMSTPGVANRASDEATARSQLATSWHPAAVATPLTAAMTGCGSATIACIIAAQLFITRSKYARPRSGAARAAVSSLRSCPAQNAGPLAAMTTARTLRSCARATSWAASASINASDRLLRCCGRFSVSTAIGPARSCNSTGSTALLALCGADAVSGIPVGSQLLLCPTIGN